MCDPFQNTQNQLFIFVHNTLSHFNIIILLYFLNIADLVCTTDADCPTDPYRMFVCFKDKCWKLYLKPKVYPIKPIK
jgi:hypothetical protein